MAETATAKWNGRLSLAQAALALILSVGGTLLTIGITQGSFAQRLSSAEQESKRIDESVKTNSAAAVPRAEYDAHAKSEQELRQLILENLKEIKDDVRALRNQNSPQR